MRAHDVRNLRQCETCGGLVFKAELLNNERVCVSCAYRATGLVGFMEKYPQDEWRKLPLSLIGVDGMRALLDRMAR
jgi:hypothetical protein